MEYNDIGQFGRERILSALERQAVRVATPTRRRATKSPAQPVAERVEVIDGRRYTVKVLAPTTPPRRVIGNGSKTYGPVGSWQPRHRRQAVDANDTSVRVRIAGRRLA